MQFKSKVVRGVAGAMLIPITYEALPRVIEPDDCVAKREHQPLLWRG